MLAYKVYSDIDEQGKLVLLNLPFRNQKCVEVLVLIEDPIEKSNDTSEKINRLKSSFGTIISRTNIPDELLSRQNLYELDGR